MSEEMIEVEPLTDAEAEAAFIALVEMLDKGSCCPVVTVASKEDEGISFSLHFSADRARKLSAYNPNERLREALVEARAVVASDAAACKVFRHPDEDLSEPERVLGVIDSALSPLPQGEDT